MLWFEIPSRLAADKILELGWSKGLVKIIMSKIPMQNAFMKLRVIYYICHVSLSPTKREKLSSHILAIFI